MNFINVLLVQILALDMAIAVLLPAAIRYNIKG